MKRIKLLVLLLFAALTAATSMPTMADSAEEDVRVVIEALQTDWNGGDMTAYLAAYVQNDDMRMLSSAGIYEGWNTVNSIFREHFPDEPRMGDFTVDSLEVRLLTDDVAVASGAFEHVFAELTVRGSFSHVLKKQEDGRWLIEHEHTSRTEVIETGE